MDKRITRWFACFICSFLVAGVASSAVDVGTPAPDFVLPSLESGNLRLSEYRSEVVVLTFWSANCARCEKAIPLYSSLQQQYGADGLNVLAISIEGDADAAVETRAEFGVGFPLLLDQKYRVSKAFKPGRLPATVVIDRTGQVVFVEEGFKRGSDEAIAAAVSELMTK